MPKVTFHYNFKKDAWSWVLIVKDRKLWGINWKDQVAFIPSKLLKQVIKKDRKTAEFLVCQYLISHPKKQIRQLIIKEELKAIESSWKKIEKKFFKRLEVITQQPIFTNHFRCYFTSGFMCPYNEKENWFMVSMWRAVPSQITTVCHELLHFQFLHHYKKHCKIFLSKKQIENLKESLTFLLNTDFNDLLLCEDFGYPDHKKFRQELKKIWQKEKNFKKFLSAAIKIIRR